MMQLYWQAYSEFNAKAQGLNSNGAVPGHFSTVILVTDRGGFNE